MEALYIVVVVAFVLFILLRMPKQMMRLLGNGIVRITIATLLLFFLNVFGGYIGLHIPINIFTVFVSTLLGFAGIASLVAIHLFLLS